MENGVVRYFISDTFRRGAILVVGGRVVAAPVEFKKVIGMELKKAAKVFVKMGRKLMQ